MDIVACGANFICEEAITGSRMPPAVLSHDLMRDRRLVKQDFVTFYNAFRPWWGKLFRAEFFLKHYDYAWRNIVTHLFMDTSVMLRYMRRCGGFSSVCEPLYQFRLHAASSYAAMRAPNNSRLLEAENLWEEGNETLTAFQAMSEENRNFLNLLNWTYIKEYLPGLLSARDASPHKQLGWLAATFNSAVLARYIRDAEKEVLETALEYTQAVCKRESSDYTLYASYLVRLRYFLILYGQNPANQVLPALLVGCLSDPVNENYLGLAMMSALKIQTKGFEIVAANLAYYTAAKSSFNVWADEITGQDDTDAVKALESRLASCFQAEDYAGVCDLIEQIVKLSPLNSCALYHRIQMAVLVEEWELAAALCHTARTLWPNDAQMQLLLWSVMKDLS